MIRDRLSERQALDGRRGEIPPLRFARLVFDDLVRQKNPRLGGDGVPTACGYFF
jgi:hypothetical protein